MDYIQVGKIINTHGIKGEVSIYPLTDNNSRFYDLKKAYLGQKKIEVHIDGVRSHRDKVLLKFKEFDNINDVLQYKGEYIYIDIEDKVALPGNHFFLFDVIGSTVYTKTGERVGVVSQIIQSASNDIYVIQNYEKNKEYMIPAIREFVISISVEDKLIIIDPIEGMIE